MSRYFNREMAQQALQMMIPSITAALVGPSANRSEGYIRVSALQEDGNWETFLTHDFGNRTGWQYDYEKYATSKAMITQRTGKPSREVHGVYPELVEDGDTSYFGSVTSPGGTIVVAFSGVQSYFDVMFAEWVLAACLGLIQHELERCKTVGEEDFYGEVTSD